MHYLGGKYQIMKPISEIINNYLSEKPEEERNFVSLFVGAGNVEQWIHCKKLLNDKHPYLIAMWKDLQNGREFPSEVTVEEYKDIKANQDRDPGLTGFVGFGCSFSGKWWGGYARGRENYADEAKRGLNKKIKNGVLLNSTFTCNDYKDVVIPDGSVVYCDPPYYGTTRYATNVLGKFNNKEFWEYMRQISKNNTVLISEFVGPDDFECIWSKARKLNIADKDGIKQVKIEKLFKYKG